MKKLIQFTAILLLFSCSARQAAGQKMMMQGWYWDYPKVGNGKWWCDTLAHKAKILSKAGFNFLWLPPMSMSSSGNTSNGYDAYDLFNIGLNNFNNTGFGNIVHISKMIDSLNKYGICPVADMVFNQRTGGLEENNPDVQSWITNYNLTLHNNGNDCYPSDRFQCILPIAGVSRLDTGNYYIKVSSASGSTDYVGKQYRFYAYTKRKGNAALVDDTVIANDGGGDCGQDNNKVTLGRGIVATVKSQTVCGTDEFKVRIDTGDYYHSGDTIYVTLANYNGNYADQRIYGIWYSGTNSNVVDSLKYQTATDFTRVPSHRGQMNYSNFHPSANATCLCGDWDYPLFFYDYDQSVAGTTDTLEAWTKWMMQNIGVKGLRLDAVKNYPPTFTGQLLQYLHYQNLNPKMVVGESYDFDAGTLKSRIQSIYANMDQATSNAIVVSVFDFSMQLAMKNACDTYGYDERNVFTSGMVDNQGMSGINSVTFVNNHDFRQASQSVNTDPILAYAYLITNPTIGTPCIYYTDYYSKTHPDYTVRMNHLINCYYKYIQGSTNKAYLNEFNTFYSGNFTSGASNTTLFYQISSPQGGCLTNKDAIVVINFSGGALNVTQHVSTGSPFYIRTGDTLTDVLGYSGQPFVVVDANSQITVTLPARGYSVWAQEGKVHTPAISITNGSTICNGATSLAVNTTYSCYDYQWQLNGVNIAGANDATLQANQPGDYRLVASYNGASAKNSNVIHVYTHPDIPSVTFDNTNLNSSLAVSYQWYYGADSLSASSISGATNQNYTPLQTGFYNVKIIDSSGCSNPSHFFYLQVNGVNNVSAQDNISIYPNPVGDKIYIIASGQENYQSIELLNLMGSVVKQIQFPSAITSFSNAIDVSNLPAGIYFVRIKSDEALVVKKVVKE